MHSNAIDWRCHVRRLIFAITTALIAAAPTDATAGTGERTRDVPLMTTTPPACRAFLREPRDAISVIFRWDQRLSFASCLRATTTVAPIEPGDLQALPRLIAHLEDSFARSIAIYRDAMSFGPPEIRIQAAYGLATTYLDIAIRARLALTPDDARGRFALEPLLEPTFRSAIAAYDEVGFLADDFPKAARANAVTAYAVTHARFQARLLRER
jgi:hypothetical protein